MVLGAMQLTAGVKRFSEQLHKLQSRFPAPGPRAHLFWAIEPHGTSAAKGKNVDEIKTAC